MVQLQ